MRCRPIHSLTALIACMPLAAGAQAADAPAEPFASCVTALKAELPSKVKPETFDTYASSATDLRPVIENLTSGQPEFQAPIWDYINRRTDATHVEQGRELLSSSAEALDAIAKRVGVDAETTVAVFGVETNYGRITGSYPVIDATLSRACLNLKNAERKEHFFNALWLVQEGIVNVDEFKGSWAGAFGMTQFMPGTFVRFMKDGDGAPADIIHSVPDSLATTARYLRSLGWKPGAPWAVEVRVPLRVALAWNAPEADHACLAQAAPAGKCRNVAAWAADGVTRIDGKPLDKDSESATALDPATPAALLMPAGSGPAWLVTANYQAIWRYNRADAYALAIGLLADALRGAPPLIAAWPTDDGGLTRDEFLEFQSTLLKLGHCDVLVDGAAGPKTSAAIREEERRLGWVETGRGGRKLFDALKGMNALVAVSCAASTAPLSSAMPSEPAMASGTDAAAQPAGATAPDAAASTPDAQAAPPGTPASSPDAPASAPDAPAPPASAP